MIDPLRISVLPGKSRSVFFQTIVPWLLAATCFVWRSYFLDSRDICLDEPFTIFHAQKSIGDIVMLTVNGEPNPPLFMILVHFGIKIFGITKALRLIPLLFSSLTLVFLYKCALRLGNVYSALLASFLFLFSSLHFFFGLEVRTYSLLSFLAAVTYYLVIRIVSGDKEKWIVPTLVFVNACISLTHYFGWFIILNEALVIFFYFRQQDPVKKIIKVLLLTLVACSPMLFLMGKQFLSSAKGTWVQPPGEGVQWLYLATFLNGDTPYTCIKYILLIALIVYVFYVVRHKAIDWPRLRMVAILLTWFALPFFSMYLISGKVPMFVDRYILFNTIALYLFIGVALTMFLSRWFLQPAALILITWLSAMHLTINDRNFYHREVAGAVGHVQRYRDSSAVILIHPLWLDLEYTYHSDPELFKTAGNIGATLNSRKIFPVSTVNRVPDTLDKYAPRYVIAYGYDLEALSQKLMEDQRTATMWTLVDSAFYPQGNYVLVYERVN